VTAAEVDALQAIVRAGTSEQRAVTRARIVLLAADGLANTRIAERVGVSLPTVLLWRSRFAEHGLHRTRVGRGCMGERCARRSWRRR
jgi:hypothetical protein